MGGRKGWEKRNKVKKQMCTQGCSNLVEEHIRTGNQSKSVQLQQKPIVMAKLLNRTKNRKLVTCTLSKITFYIACAVCVIIFSTGGKFRPVFFFYVVTRSYSSRPFLCAQLVPRPLSLLLIHVIKHKGSEPRPEYCQVCTFSLRFGELPLSVCGTTGSVLRT